MKVIAVRTVACFLFVIALTAALSIPSGIGEPDISTVETALTTPEGAGGGALSSSALPPPATSSAAATDTSPPPSSDTAETSAATTAATTASSPAAETAPPGYLPAVLMYHLVREEPYSALEALFLRPSEFEDQLKALAKAKYEFLFTDEYARLPFRSVMLTFDDGYAECYTEAFPLLKQYGAKATVFVIADSVGKAGYLSAEMIGEMAESGLVSFGSHTLSHADLRALSDARLERELRRSQEKIAELSGQAVLSVCYPAGGVDDRVSAAAAKYYRFGFTSRNAPRGDGEKLLGIPRLRVSRGDGGREVVARIR